MKNITDLLFSEAQQQAVRDHLAELRKAYDDALMFLARQVPGISYEAAMHWPPWKVASRMRHARMWLEAEEKATADSIKAAR